MCGGTEAEECHTRIKALSEALQESNVDRVCQMFKLAALGDREALEKFEAFIDGL